MKKVYAVICILICTGICWAIDVEEEELTSVKLGSVEFLNYSGPHDKIETREQIAGIGSILGGQSIREAAYAGKYRIIRAVSENTSLLNADIFIVESGAMVDHIDNIRRIIAAYLSSSYGYSNKDSSLLAEFCSYYNAVYRGNITYFSSKYHEGVTSNISAANAGISTSYKDWPGKTRMLIPLKATGKIDADVISDENVVEKLREEEDKGIPERKELVEYKEKEIEESQEDIDIQREEIREEQKAIAQEEETIEEQKEVLEESKSTMTEEEVVEKEKEIAQKEEVLEERREEVVQKEALVEEAEKQQQERVERIQEERAEIAKDQQALLDEEKGTTSAAVVRGKEILFLKKNSDNSNAPGTLVFLNTATGKETKSSPVTTVHSPTIQLYGRDIIVIAGEEGGNRAIRLALIDPQTLEMKKQGDTDMFPASYILISGNTIYGVVKKGSGYSLGKFNNELGLESTSEISVMPNTWMRLDGGNLFVQTNKGIIALDANTLAEGD